MSYKRKVIAGLIIVNVFLMAVLVTMSWTPDPVLAQRGGSGGGKYLAVTAEYTGGTDALILMHTGKGILTALTPSQTTGELQITDSRDLNQDFPSGR